MQVKYTRYAVEVHNPLTGGGSLSPTFASKRKAQEHADSLNLAPGTHASILFIGYDGQRKEVHRDYCLDGFRYRVGGAARV